MTKREIIKVLQDKEIPDRVGLNEHFWPFIPETGRGDRGVTTNCSYC